MTNSQRPDSGNVTSITIHDMILSEGQLAKLGALKFDFALKKLVDLKILSCTRNYLKGYPCIEHMKKLEFINFSSCRIPTQELNKLVTTLSKLSTSLRVFLSLIMDLELMIM